MAGNDKFKLPGKISKLLNKLSRPLEADLKKKRNKEMIKNDFLVTASRTDYILEKLFTLVNAQIKTETEREHAFTMLIDLLLALYSHIIIIYCIAVAGWNEQNKLTKAEEKKLNTLLKDIQTLGKRIISKHRTDR